MSAKKKHIVSVVSNKVEGDSRVIKTAQAAINAGYRATILGVSKKASNEITEVEGVPTILVPNFSHHLGKLGLWPHERDLRLLIGGFFRRVEPEIQALAPDLLHSHDMLGLKIGAAAVNSMRAAGRSTKWVHDLHEYVAGLKGDLAEAYMPTCLGWEREFLHRPDHLVTVSENLADILKDRYLLKATPTVVHNTPALANFNASGPNIRGAIGLTEDIPLVVFVGGATALRGCDTILEAISLLDGANLAFVSQGPYVDSLMERATSLGIRDRVHRHDYVPSSQVTTFIRSADVGINGLLHYPNAEVALPNKMFEYLHAGLPMVVSDVEAMSAFVKKHRIGTVFQAGDAEACAAALNEVLGARDKHRRNIKEDLRRRYSWETQETKLQAVYDRLLSSPARVSRKARDDAVIADKVEQIAFESALGRALAEANAKKIAVEFAKVAKGLAALEARLPEPAVQPEIATSQALQKGFKRIRNEVGSLRQEIVEFDRRSQEGLNKTIPILTKLMKRIHLELSKPAAEPMRAAETIAGPLLPPAAESGLPVKRSALARIARLVRPNS